MISLDDLKERIKTEWQQTWEKIQSSGLFQKVQDRYENLSPPQQRLTLVGSIFLASFLVLSLPLSYLFSSWDSVSLFLDQRSLLRDLFRTAKETQELPQFQAPPHLEILKGQIQGTLQSLHLLPEQILGIDSTEDSYKLIPKSQVEGILAVRLGQLNLRQVLQVGYQLQTIHPSVKIKDLNLQASSKDKRYLDVTYKLMVLSLPDSESMGGPGGGEGSGSDEGGEAEPGSKVGGLKGKSGTGSSSSSKSKEKGDGSSGDEKIPEGGGGGLRGENPRDGH